MYFKVDIEDSIAEKISVIARLQGNTSEDIIRIALEEWYQRYAMSQWETGFFDFAPISDIPDFSKYRQEFGTLNENPWV